MSTEPELISEGPAITTPTIPPVVIECQQLRARAEKAEAEVADLQELLRKHAKDARELLVKVDRALVCVGIGSKDPVRLNIAHTIALLDAGGAS